MRIGEIFVAALIMILLVILLILLSPILVPLFIYVYIRDWIDDRRFETFLRANEGAKYFCYTARRTSYNYVREKLLPNLPAGTQIIYLNDRKNAIESMDDDIPFLHHFVWRMKETPGSYPYVSKVSNGKLVTISINQQLYSAITRHADADAINNKIQRFLAAADESMSSSSNPKSKI